MRPGALLHLVHGHEGEVDVLQEGGQDVRSTLGVVSNPADHRLVDLALGGHQQLRAGDEAGDLLPGQRREVLALYCHLQNATLGLPHYKTQHRVSTLHLSEDH